MNENQENSNMDDDDYEKIRSILSNHLTSFIEFYKIRIDLFKHLTTLSSASIVFIAGFSQQIKMENGNNCFLVLGLLGLIVTIISCSWTCFHILGVMMKTKMFINGLANIQEVLDVERGNWWGFFSIGSFVLSLIFILIFLIQKIS